METKWPFSLPSAEDDAGLTEGPLDTEAIASAVRGADRGAVVVFEGRVRGEERGGPIASITYEAYESMALEGLRRISREIEEKWGVRAAIHHRLGTVPVGEASLVVACGGGHRPEAFEACRYAVEQVKARVPIWKVTFERIPCVSAPAS